MIFLQLQDNTVSGSEQLLSQNAFGYVLPITSFVVAWLETWFLDFKVLTQEADDDRGESGRPGRRGRDRTTTRVTTFPPSSSSSSPAAYLAAVNAACERAPMLYPRPVSDGQFYSPPESVAGDPLDPLLVSVVTSEPRTEPFLLTVLQVLRRTWMRRAWDAGL